MNHLPWIFIHLHSCTYCKKIERTNVFSKKYDILEFSNFLYLPQITQYIFFTFLVIKNILVLFYHCFHNY